MIDAGRYERSLFVGAHLDDIELAAGGTSAVLAKEGCQVHWLVLSNSSYERRRGGRYEYAEHGVEVPERGRRCSTRTRS